jgi:hypothetical protein
MARRLLCVRSMRCLTAARDPVSTGACTGLDAQACSRHDNWSAWYLETSPGTTKFEHCADEAPAAR